MDFLNAYAPRSPEQMRRDNEAWDRCHEQLVQRQLAELEAKRMRKVYCVTCRRELPN